MRVLSRLVEIYSDLRWRSAMRSRVLGEGCTALIPATRLHEVSNPGPTDALSVHVYSPPLRSMTFFDDLASAWLGDRTVTSCV